MTARHERLTFGVAALVLAGCAVLAGLWWNGLRWRTVSTPSMAESAPVGTLLITAPAKHVHVGEFIVFHPPTAPKLTYAHRVYSIAPDGSIQTKGDLNAAPDPWTLPPQSVPARVVARLWGVGWLLRALPILLAGLLAVLTLGHYCLRPDSRLPAEVLLSSLVTALTLLWLQPLVRADVLSMQVNRGSGSAALVGTGLLPIRASAPGASPMVLRPGQSGVLTGVRVGPESHFSVHIAPALNLGLWLVLALCWLLPLIVLLAVGVEPREPSRHRSSLAG